MTIKFIVFSHEIMMIMMVINVDCERELFKLGIDNLPTNYDDDDDDDNNNKINPIKTNSKFFESKKKNYIKFIAVVC